MDDRTLQRIFYAAMTVLALGALGLGLIAAGGPGMAFGLFSFLTLGGSLVCIWERSVVRSAFALMATFSGVAGFFLLLVTWATPPAAERAACSGTRAGG